VGTLSSPSARPLLADETKKLHANVVEPALGGVPVRIASSSRRPVESPSCRLPGSRVQYLYLAL